MTASEQVVFPKLSTTRPRATCVLPKWSQSGINTVSIIEHDGSGVQTPLRRPETWKKKKNKTFFFRQKHKRCYVLIQMGGWILNAGLSKTVDREYDD